jgi:hypothetical protein
MTGRSDDGTRRRSECAFPLAVRVVGVVSGSSPNASTAETYAANLRNRRRRLGLRAASHPTDGHPPIRLQSPQSGLTAASFANMRDSLNRLVFIRANARAVE